MQFSAKIYPNNRFLTQCVELATRSPLQNPGSATDSNKMGAEPNVLHWQIQRGARDAHHPWVQILSFSCSFQQNCNFGSWTPLRKTLHPPLCWYMPLGSKPPSHNSFQTILLASLSDSVMNVMPLQQKWYHGYFRMSALRLHRFFQMSAAKENFLLVVQRLCITEIVSAKDQPTVSVNEDIICPKTHRFKSKDIDLFRTLKKIFTICEI